MYTVQYKCTLYSTIQPAPAVSIINKPGVLYSTSVHCSVLYSVQPAPAVSIINKPGVQYSKSVYTVQYKSTLYSTVQPAPAVSIINKPGVTPALLSQLSQVYSHTFWSQLP